MTQVAQELLAQNIKAKDAAKAIKFNFKEFSTDVNGYAVSLINNNTALVIDIAFPYIEKQSLLKIRKYTCIGHYISAFICSQRKFCVFSHI